MLESFQAAETGIYMSMVEQLKPSLVFKEYNITMWVYFDFCHRFTFTEKAFTYISYEKKV